MTFRHAALITSYDAVTGGNVVNQVKREFNGLGQLTSEWQEHGGAVTGSSPRVQYAYSEMAGGANHSRLVSITYPDGRVLNYNYAAGLDDAISRLSSLSDASGTLESYDYLGEALVVSRKHPQPGVDLTYVKRAGEANGDAGDPYVGLDRFGRIVDQRWLKSGDGSALDRLQYSYDRNGNRLSRTNLIDAAFSESYSYDNLNQLTGFTRGSHNRSWDCTRAAGSTPRAACTTSATATIPPPSAAGRVSTRSATTRAMSISTAPSSTPRRTSPIRAGRLSGCRSS